MGHIQELSMGHPNDLYNTKCESSAGMKFYYNSEAWMGTMIVMG